MTYVSKSDYIKIRMYIMAGILVIPTIYLLSNDIMAIDVALFLVAIILLVCFFLLGGRWEKTIGEMARNVPREDIQCFIDSIEKHIPVLARKKKILTQKDDYGYIVTDKWNSEKLSYLRKLNYIPHSTSFYDGITIEQQSTIIDSIVDGYSYENEVKTNYRDDMNPSEYEYFCAEILSDNGWDARTTPTSGDQGVDVIASKDNVTIAIQCKKYSNPVGNAAVQEVVAGRDYYDANVAAVVTNNIYTPSARMLAKVHGVYLLHHDQLSNIDMILSTKEESVHYNE